MDKPSRPTAADPAPDDGQGSEASALNPVATAVVYVASTDQLMAHSPIGRREIFRRLVVASAVADQMEAFDAAATSLADTLDLTVDRLTWVEAPLTATLVSSSGSTASVDVWAVSILGAPDSGPPQQAWRTVHVDLELVDDVWMVSGATADAGPTPRANDLALPAAWDDFAVVAHWPAVVEGVGL
jgi:hypothetical protein